MGGAHGYDLFCFPLMNRRDTSITSTCRSVILLTREERSLDVCARDYSHLATGQSIIQLHWEPSKLEVVTSVTLIDGNICSISIFLGCDLDSSQSDGISGAVFIWDEFGSWYTRKSNSIGKTCSVSQEAKTVKRCSDY